jgi:hypothetical protein
MISAKQYFTLQVLFLLHLLYISKGLFISMKIPFNIRILGNALQCKTCEKNDPSCLLADEVEIRDCPSDEDFCYSWFDRTSKFEHFSFEEKNKKFFYSESEIGVQRGCISPDMGEYKMIRKMLGDKDNECFKRINGLDCFKLCSNDKCN